MNVTRTFSQEEAQCLRGDSLRDVIDGSGNFVRDVVLFWFSFLALGRSREYFLIYGVVFGQCGISLKYDISRVISILRLKSSNLITISPCCHSVVLSWETSE